MIGVSSLCVRVSEGGARGQEGDMPGELGYA